jgi:hypothetical protein
MDAARTTLEQCLGPLLTGRLDALAGRSVLVISSAGALSLPAPFGHAEVLQLAASSALASLPEGQRFDLGLVAGGLGTLPEHQARALLAALRDRACRTTVVVEPGDSPWGRAQMLALAFTQRAQSACGQWRLYDHDLSDYNPEREWNNPTDWANPENFDRYRW